MISNKKWRLDGKKALITGGTKGIGYATAQTFLELGAQVVITARNAQAVESCVASWKAQGFNAHGVASDVSAQDGCETLYSFVEKTWGSLDILVNNAGTNVRKATMEYEDKDILTIVNSNITSAFVLSRLCHAMLKKSGNGCVVNVSSIAGINAMRSGAMYAMTKAAMIQMTRSLGVEWAKDAIRVNSVAPGFTSTPLTEFWKSNEVVMNEIREKTPLGRMGEADEIAAAIAFLAMPVSSFTTGQTLVVDGGFLTKAF